jgi:3-(3-hydroxy-phenyl)propionate hydroxylase
MRRAVLSLAVRNASVRSLINPRQTSAITYSDSPLNVPDRDEDDFAAGPVPGAVLPECPLTIVNDGDVKEAYITDFVEPCFTVFLFSETGAISDDFAALAEALMREKQLRLRCVPLVRHLNSGAEGLQAWDHTGRLFEMYGAKSGTIYLMRPDGHVLGRWHDASCSDVAAALEHALHA